MPTIRQALLAIPLGACLALSGCGAEHATPNQPPKPITIVQKGTLKAAAISPAGQILAAVDSGKLYQIEGSSHLSLPAAPSKIQDLGFQGQTPVALLLDDAPYDAHANLGFLENGAWRVLTRALTTPFGDSYFTKLRLLSQANTISVLGLLEKNVWCSDVTNYLLKTSCSNSGCTPQTSLELPNGGYPLYGLDLSNTPENTVSAFYLHYDYSHPYNLFNLDFISNKNSVEIYLNPEESLYSIQAFLLGQRLYIVGLGGGNTLLFYSRGQATQWEHASQSVPSFNNSALPFTACATADSIEVVWKGCPNDGRISGLYHASIRDQRWSQESLIPGTEYACNGDTATAVKAVCGPNRLHVLWSTANQGVRYISLPTP